MLHLSLFTQNFVFKGQNVVQDINEHYICKIELINITSV